MRNAMSLSQSPLIGLATLFILGLAVKPAQAQANLIVNGNFSSGNTGFSTGYSVRNSGDPGPGSYTVGANPHDFNAGGGSYGDHTTGGGLMLIADGSQTANVPVWSETLAVAPSSAYSFSFFVSSWGEFGSATQAYDPASLQVFVNGVAVGPVIFTPSSIGVWENHTLLLSPFSTPTALISLVDLNTDFVGNDFALDDFKLNAVPVPEASSLISFGLILALGLGIVVARKRKAASNPA